MADPFLFLHKNRIWVFYEKETEYGKGNIYAYSTVNLADWIDEGLVLERNYHLSFPQVFEFKNQIFMLPESAEKGCVQLFRTENFPKDWIEDKILIPLPLLDPSLFHWQGFWYIFGNAIAGETRLFYSQNLNSTFVEHPLSPIKTEIGLERSGGRIVEVDGAILRPIQDSREGYGKKLRIMKIEQLSPTDFSEVVFADDFYPRKDKWNQWGGHHLDVLQFGGFTFMAMDGKGPGNVFNNFPYAYWKITKR